MIWILIALAIYSGLMTFLYVVVQGSADDMTAELRRRDRIDQGREDIERARAMAQHPAGGRVVPGPWGSEW